MEKRANKVREEIDGSHIWLPPTAWKDFSQGTIAMGLECV